MTALPKFQSTDFPTDHFCTIGSKYALCSYLLNIFVQAVFLSYVEYLTYITFLSDSDKQ